MLEWTGNSPGLNPVENLWQTSNRQSTENQTEAIKEVWVTEGRKEMFYLTTHSTHFIYGYMVKNHSDRWREETRCRHIGYSFRLAARVLLYASSHRQDNTYHGICCTSRGALAGTRNSSARGRQSRKFGSLKEGRKCFI